MGLDKFLRPITAVVDRANEVFEDLEDQVDHWRDVAAREHDRRVKGLADAKIAIAEAKSNTAIIMAESRAAAAEAEARGVARGSVQGYQRALDENDMFDAGFESGRKRRESMPNTQRSTLVSGSQARTQAPPPSPGNKIKSGTGESSTLQGSKQYMSERSGRLRHDPPTVERSGNRPSNKSPESKAASSHRSTHRTDEKSNISKQECRPPGIESGVGPSKKANSATSTGKDQAKDQSGHSTTPSRRTTRDSRAELPTAKSTRSGNDISTASKRTTENGRAELPAKNSSRSGDKEATPSLSIASSPSTVLPYAKSTVHPRSSISQAEARPDAPSAVHPSSSASIPTTRERKHESSKSASHSAAQSNTRSKKPSGKSAPHSKTPLNNDSTAPSTQVASHQETQSETRSTVPSSKPTSRSKTSATQPNTSSKMTSSQSGPYTTSQAGVRGSVPSSSTAAHFNGDSSTQSTVTSGTSQVSSRRLSQMRRRDRPFYEDME